MRRCYNLEDYKGLMLVLQQDKWRATSVDAIRNRKTDRTTYSRAMPSSSVLLSLTRQGLAIAVLAYVVQCQQMEHFTAVFRLYNASTRFDNQHLIITLHLAAKRRLRFGDGRRLRRQNQRGNTLTLFLFLFQRGSEDRFSFACSST